MRSNALVVLASLAGCGIEMSPTQPWIPIADVGVPLTPEMFPSARVRTETRTATDPVRVVTYNVQYAPDVPALSRAMTDTDLAIADVVLVQEIEAYPSESVSRASQLASDLGDSVVYVPARLRNGGTHGLAILSRFPILNVEKMDLPEPSQPTAHRIAIRADIEIDGRMLHVINVHLDTMLGANERVAQLHPAVIDAVPGTIIGGDFNTSWVAWADGVPILDTTGASDQAPIIDSYMTQLGWDAPTRGSGATERMYGIEQRLDSMYALELGASFGGVAHVGPSDHWPLWIDVMVP
jgi:endonuclease/exonuclease/phosphatase family metal-dependent hydrolase